MNSIPVSHPAYRPWPWPEVMNPGRYPSIDFARNWSCQQMLRIRERLESPGRLPSEIALVAASGSLGRLDACELSDCDLIVVFHDGVPTQDAGARAAMERVWDVLEDLNLPRPKPAGIYAVPTTRAQLCDRGTLGVIAEDRAVFGKRFGLLLDSQPVYGLEEHDRLIRGIVDRYAAGFVEHDSTKEWVYLLNDLTRYFRSFCLWRQMDFTRDHEGWYIRNAKLRHSRVLMYAGLLFLLGECSKEKRDKPGWLAGRLKLTAMERVAACYGEHRDPGFSVIAEAYDRFLDRMGDPTFRNALVARAPANLEEMNRVSLPEYDLMHANSAKLISELLRFTLDRRADWSQGFFEFLFF